MLCSYSCFGGASAAFAIAAAAGCWDGGGNSCFRHGDKDRFCTVYLV